MNKLLSVIVISATCAFAGEIEYIWPEGKMPDAQTNQFARMTYENKSTNRVAYLEWFDAPTNSNAGCMIMISGGGYNKCCDVSLARRTWPAKFTAAGFQCVNFVYRTPRPEGLPIYQSAWEDGQRAVRFVRNEAEKRGFDPEKIGVISMSAGSHLATLLATSSQTPAYEPVDELDKLPCHINFAITGAIAYGLTTSAVGKPDVDGGKGGVPGPEFKFDEKTCPMCMLHGGKDVYSPLASTQIYRELRKRKVPAEVHVWSDRGHGGFWADNWWECALGFIRQLNLDGKLGPEVDLKSRFPDNSARDESKYLKENVWPDGKMPNASTNQCVPYIEWHFPKEQKTKSVQVLYSGGGYHQNSPDGTGVAAVRRFLNEHGMTVVTLKYRSPRPVGSEKHMSAWQDLQRTIRIVRSRAEGLGLDSNMIGVMGSSAGAHLTLMGVLSSTKQAYEPIDELDQFPCNVQWGICLYTAYALTDGVNGYNSHGGNTDIDVIVPEFAFDGKECPVLFVHGDADPYAAMGSVKVWERLREKGVYGDLHTLVKRGHTFQIKAAEDTGSYTFLNRIWEFMCRRGINK